MMVGDSTPVIPETSKVGLGTLLFFNGNSHNFDLIIGKADLDFELVWHNKFISFDRIIVGLLLLCNLVPFLIHHLLLKLLSTKQETRFEPK